MQQHGLLKLSFLSLISYVSDVFQFNLGLKIIFRLAGMGRALLICVIKIAVA